MRSDIDHDEIRALGRSPIIWRLLEPAAMAVQAAAIASAPIHDERRKDRAPGTYKRSITARRLWTAELIKCWNVGSPDQAARFVEGGSYHGHQKAQHTLANAARKVGLRVVDITK
jgi:hypothetical protein